MKKLLTLSLALVSANLSFAQSATTSDYKVTPSDILSVLVVGEEYLTLDVPVSSTGAISYPYLGNIEVKGKTTAEIQSIIREKLVADYMVNPQVIVSVKAYMERKVSVTGAVITPGPVVLLPEQRMDLLQALAEAGGISRVGNENAIELTRDGVTTVYKRSDLQKIKDDGQKIWLKPNDTIFVRESRI